MSRRCARPGCGREASTTMSFSYAERAVWLEDLHESGHPANHDLCRAHADRTRAPRGWELRDRRAGISGEPTGLGLRPTG